MYHVLIVDDEKYIRRSIINRIDWEKCGGEVIGEAADGEEAYEMIGLYQPEVVITDIRMPGMDGLKLAEIVSREYPHIKLVLISAYNDFEYARKAIQYGVKEYLLKPVMEEEMEEVLIRLEKERKQSEKNYSVPEISGYTAAQEEFTGGRFLVTSFYMPEIKDEVQRRERIFKLYHILSAHTESKEKQTKLLLVRDGREDQCSVLWNGNWITEEEVCRLLKELERQVGEDVFSFVGISRVLTTERLEERDLFVLQAEGLEALKSKIFDRGKYLFFYEEDKQEYISKYKNELLRLYDLSVQEEWERLEWLMEEFIIHKLPGVSHVFELEFLIQELIFVLERHSRRFGYLYETQVLFHDLKKTDFLLPFENLLHLSRTMKELSDTVLSYSRSRDRYDVIEDIREYVQGHYMENIAVAQIAKQYHLNAAYLSTVFKERNNISLSSYIEGVRMEKAKRFLKEDWGNITEVALAAGYSDSNYFTKVFKKYTGMTPSQWKRKKEEEN